MYTYVPYMPYIYTYVLHTRTHTHTHTHAHTHTHTQSKGPGEQGEQKAGAGGAGAGAGAGGRGAGGNLAKGNFEQERQEHREAPSLSARPLALRSIPRALRGRDATEAGSVDGS
jgi:hypothetical protein